MKKKKGQEKSKKQASKNSSKRAERVIEKPAEKEALMELISISKRTWSGPLPPPEILKEYPRDVRKSIILRAEEQMHHRHKIEDKVIDSNMKNSSKAMNYAFFMTILFMILGTYLISSGKTVEGLLATFGAPGFHAGNYIFQKYRELKEIGNGSEEKDDKTKELKQ